MDSLKKIINNFLFKKCKIEPLENLDGTITAICFSPKALEIQVRYYIDGKQETSWFYDFEILMQV